MRRGLRSLAIASFHASCAQLCVAAQSGAASAPALEYKSDEGAVLPSLQHWIAAALVCALVLWFIVAFLRRQASFGRLRTSRGSRLLEMKYENTDETEADVIGSDIASRAGFDPRAAVTLWDKLAQATRSNRDQGFIYVHPYTPARRQDIIKRLPDMLPLYAKAIGKTVDALPDYAGMGLPRRKLVRD